MILSKYSNSVSKIMGNNFVHVLATLFLLSNAKLFHITIIALSYTTLHTSEGFQAVGSADGNVIYLGPKHTISFAAAVACLLFIWFPYTLILFFGQWLQRNDGQQIRILSNLKPFLKDKHRYCFEALHLVRAVILLVSALIPANHSSIVTNSILAYAVVLVYIGNIVYQKTVVAMFNWGFFFNLVLISGTTFYTQIVSGDSLVYNNILLRLAFIQFIGLVFF